MTAEQSFPTAEGLVPDSGRSGQFASSLPRDIHFNDSQPQKADAVEHPRGIPPRRLTRQRAPRHGRGAPRLVFRLRDELLIGRGGLKGFKPPHHLVPYSLRRETQENPCPIPATLRN